MSSESVTVYIILCKVEVVIVVNGHKLVMLTYSSLDKQEVFSSFQWISCVYLNINLSHVKYISINRNKFVPTIRFIRVLRDCIGNRRASCYRLVPCKESEGVWHRLRDIVA